MVRGFTNGPGDRGSIPKSYQKLKKWYFMPPCLTLGIIKYRSMVSGAIQGCVCACDFVSEYFVGNFILNELELICLYTINGFKYHYLHK